MALLDTGVDVYAARSLKKQRDSGCVPRRRKVRSSQAASRKLNDIAVVYLEIPQELKVHIGEIAAWEGRSRARVLRLLLSLGVGVYQQMVAELSSSGVEVPAGCPTPFADPSVKLMATKEFAQITQAGAARAVEAMRAKQAAVLAAIPKRMYKDGFP